MTESTDFDSEVGSRVQALRESKGMLQAELASRVRAHGLNWSQTILSKVERGERPLRLQEAQALSRELGLQSSDDLAGLGAPLLTREAQLLWAASERHSEVVNSAFYFLRTVCELTVVRMFQALRNDRYSKWRISADIADEWWHVESSVIDEVPSPNDDARHRVFDLLGISEDELDQVAARTKELREVRTEDEYRDVWGEYAKIYPKDRWEGDSGASMMKIHAADIASAEWFYRCFPNVEIDPHLSFHEDSMAAQVGPLLTEAYKGTGRRSSWLFAKPVSGDGSDQPK